MLNVALRVASEQVAPRFGEAVFGLDKFVEQAAIGLGEIGIGTALIAGGIWFWARGAGRIARAWKKYQDGR